MIRHGCVLRCGCRSNRHLLRLRHRCRCRDRSVLRGLFELLLFLPTLLSLLLRLSGRLLSHRLLSRLLLRSTRRPALLLLLRLWLLLTLSTLLLSRSLALTELALLASTILRSHHLGLLTVHHSRRLTPSELAGSMLRLSNSSSRCCCGLDNGDSLRSLGSRCSLGCPTAGVAGSRGGSREPGLGLGSLLLALELALDICLTLAGEGLSMAKEEAPGRAPSAPSKVTPT